MGEFQQYFDIILFAMVAGFLVLRLRSVLGRRTGNERRRDLFPRRAAPASDNGATLVEPDKRSVRPADDALPADIAAEGVNRIRRADPSFDPSHFIEGARTAFEMIIAAFARGDKAVLRPLLSDEVFRQFATATDERVAAKETLETHLVSIKTAEIDEAQLNGRTAFVTVKFVSDQVNVTRAADGKIVDGESDHVVEKTDFWTFARNTRSQDPNWLLVATRSV